MDLRNRIFGALHLSSERDVRIQKCVQSLGIQCHYKYFRGRIFLGFLIKSLGYQTCQLGFTAARIPTYIQDT